MMPYTETSNLICDVNQLTCFYIIGISAGFCTTFCCDFGLSTNMVSRFYPSFWCQRKP